MHMLVVVAWLLGGLGRIYQFARFFQIEEYQNGRYARWLARNPRRWSWQRVLLAVLALLVASALLRDTPREGLLLFVHVLAAAVAAWPAPEGEIKKKFARTQRAIRLLLLSFAAYALFLLIVFSSIPLPDGLAARYGIMALLSAALFLLAPLFLVAGNLLAYPLEAGFRRLYLARARGVLRRLDPTVIGITGSYGKTSTKHFLTHMLNGRYRALATPKSYNTLMGVSLAINTVLKEARALDYFIVEMGAYIEGEIAEICCLARPRISLVTAVGPQHLERFGSMEAVAAAKYEIVAALPPEGVAVLNGDDPRVRAMAARASAAEIVLVSREGLEGARFMAGNIIETLDGLSFDVSDTATGERRHFHAPVNGLHNVTNILLATAVARQVGVPLGEIALRVAGLEPFEHRLERKIQPGGLVVLDDAYSANPVGARSALRVLGLHTGGKRILITPGMVELGAVQDEENRKLGALATQVATDIVLVGAAQTRPIYEGVTATAFDPAHLVVCDSHAEAVVWLRQHALAGDTVLFLNDLPDTYL